MEIELYQGSTRAVISTVGGYLLNLADDQGDVIYPKRMLVDATGAEKTRGGCHVCMPNFGPGGDTSLGQHGYGRSSDWQIAEQSDTQATMTLAGEGEYAALMATLVYRVDNRACTLQLVLENTGDTPLPVSPGFHPYFYRGNSTFVIDGQARPDLGGFIEASFVDGAQQTVELAGRTLALTSDNLPRWALWTDQLGEYVCVEPTQSGFAFAEDISRADLLSAGESKTYSLTITW